MQIKALTSAVQVMRYGCGVSLRYIKCAINQMCYSDDKHAETFSAKFFPNYCFSMTLVDLLEETA